MLISGALQRSNARLRQPGSNESLGRRGLGDAVHVWASKRAGRRLTKPARCEAAGSWKRRELLQAEEVQLSLKNRRRSAPFRPHCAGTAAPAGANSLSRSSCASPRGVRTLRGLRAPSASPRGAATMHTAPWGQFPKQSCQPWALFVTGRLRLPRRGDAEPRARRAQPEPRRRSPPGAGCPQSPAVTPSAPRGRGTRWPVAGEVVQTCLQRWSSSSAATPGGREGDADGAAPSRSRSRSRGPASPLRSATPRRHLLAPGGRGWRAGHGRGSVSVIPDTLPARLELSPHPRGPSPSSPFPFPLSLHPQPRRSSPASRGCGFPGPFFRG